MKNCRRRQSNAGRGLVAFLKALQDISSLKQKLKAAEAQSKLMQKQVSEHREEEHRIRQRLMEMRIKVRIVHVCGTGEGHRYIWRWALKGGRGGCHFWAARLIASCGFVDLSPHWQGDKSPGRPASPQAAISDRENGARYHKATPWCLPEVAKGKGKDYCCLASAHGSLSISLCRRESEREGEREGGREGRSEGRKEWGVVQGIHPLHPCLCPLTPKSVLILSIQMQKDAVIATENAEIEREKNRVAITATAS